MLRSTALETRALARQAAAAPLNVTKPASRRLHSSRPPRTTHSFASGPSAGTQEAFSSGFRSNRKLLVAAGAAALAGTAYLASGSSDDAPLLPANLNPNDPLSALDPSILARTTAHLTAAALPDLVRQWVVYAVSEQSLLVSMGPWMVAKLQWANDNVPVLGPAVWAVFAAGMDNTFYRVFVGGESVPGCAETVQTYANRGIGVMLNYSAEAPLGSSKAGGGIDQAAMNEITTAVSQAAKLTPMASTSTDAVKPALLAIKLSGLIYDASILARASLALASDSTTARGGRLPSSTLFPQSPELSSEDHELLDKLYDGLRKVASEAQTHNLRLLVDAEQSWFQPAIDRYVDLLSEEFNKVRPSSSSSAAPSAPVVYNTYQCYLRDAPTRIAAALAHADEHGYSFGAKLVRGAYQESERKRHEVTPAFQAGVPCVVWGSKAETDRCYDECAALLEKRIAQDLKKKNAAKEAGVGVVLASHNGTSMKRFLEALRDDGLAKEEDGALAVDDRLRGRVAFGQLMGMSDNLTITLTNIIRPPTDPSAAPLVVKYMPYASLEQGLPYLVRRANENQSILQGDPTSGRGGAREERRAVGKEIRRRMGLSF
ncbi:proline dehydrogenase [Rhodotorula kratochvilovae]